MTHPAIRPDATAVITGGGGGIGLALGQRLAQAGLSIVIVDTDAAKLTEAETTLRAAGAKDVLTRSADVADAGAMAALEADVTEAFGGADLVVANAGVQGGSSILGGDDWARVISVNLWGIIHTARAFAPGMVARDRPGTIVCTGSKQGITTPPGDPAYNVSKTGVKAFTEALAHELRNSENPQVTAHLLIPGFVFTDLTSRGRAEKPAGAWTPEETADFALDRMGQGDFYILCPDNDVPRALDEKRMAWAMGDIIENRPPLSRWHPDWGAAFEAFVAKD